MLCSLRTRSDWLPVSVNLVFRDDMLHIFVLILPNLKRRQIFLLRDQFMRATMEGILGNELDRMLWGQTAVDDVTLSRYIFVHNFTYVRKALMLTQHDAIFAAHPSQTHQRFNGALWAPLVSRWARGNRAVSSCSESTRGNLAARRVLRNLKCKNDACNDCLNSFLWN